MLHVTTLTVANGFAITYFILGWQWYIFVLNIDVLIPVSLNVMSKLLVSISLNTYVRTKDSCKVKQKTLLSERKHRAKTIYLMLQKCKRALILQKTNIFSLLLYKSLNYLLKEECDSGFWMMTHSFTHSCLVLGSWISVKTHTHIAIHMCLPNLCLSLRLKGAIQQKRSGGEVWCFGDLTLTILPAHLPALFKSPWLWVVSKPVSWIAFLPSFNLEENIGDWVQSRYSQ